MCLQIEHEREEELLEKRQQTILWYDLLSCNYVKTNNLFQYELLIILQLIKKQIGGINYMQSTVELRYMSRSILNLHILE